MMDQLCWGSTNSKVDPSGCETPCAQVAYNSGVSTATEDTRGKPARLAVRLTTRQDALIREATADTGQTLTDFVTSAAVAHAEDILTDRRVFELDAAAWEEFSALLDRPAKPVEELRTLLGERAPWDRQPGDQQE